MDNIGIGELKRVKNKQTFINELCRVHDRTLLNIRYRSHFKNKKMFWVSFHACTIIIRSCPYVHLCIHALRHRHDHHSRSRLRLHNMLTYERTYIDTYTCTKMNSIERVCVPYKTKSMHFKDFEVDAHIYPANIYHIQLRLHM